MGRRGKELSDKRYVMKLVAENNWVSSDGRSRPVSGMDTAHIRNAIRWVERTDDIAAKDMLVSMFERELELRGADVPASAELEDRWRELCNITRDLFAYYKRNRGPQYAERYRMRLESLGVDVR